MAGGAAEDDGAGGGHAGYLINLAGPPGDFRDKSITLFREELLRCEVLDIPLLVVHPGAHVGLGEEAGLRQVAVALDEVHEELPGLKVITCLEITAGSGTHLGHSFGHLRRIIEMIRQPEARGGVLRHGASAGGGV